jgi:pyruvyltransferase
MNAGPIRLFWWEKVANFGDRMAADIVQAVSKRRVERASPFEAELFATGSIVTAAMRGAGPRRKAGRPVVWGSGLMGAVPADIAARRVDYVAVRGPLTQALLDLGPLPLGDPGLLAVDLFAAPARGETIGIVLHHSQKPDPLLKGRLQASGPYLFIDPTDPDHLGVIRQIAACRHVFSSSLHGLIVADAFGVPNTWLDATGIHHSAAFKFHDYALSIRRLLNIPVALQDIAEAVRHLPTGLDEPGYMAEVKAVRAGLRESFPHALLTHSAGDIDPAFIPRTLPRAHDLPEGR